MLVMGYSNCPLLCSQVLGELTRSLKPLDASVGKDFDILTVSIDPKETPEQADGPEAGLPEAVQPAGAEAGWHALVGDEESIASSWPRRSGSGTSTARGPASTPTPPGSSC